MGVTVNVVVAPCKIDCAVFGLMVPLAPADGVTPNEATVGRKLAVTVQFELRGFVVNW